MDCEIEALIAFIEAREPGSVLRQIAKTRLERVMKVADVYVEPAPRIVLNQATPLIEPATGRVFRSTFQAAKEMRVNRNTIKRDINIGKNKYGLYRVSDYSY